MDLTVLKQTAICMVYNRALALRIRIYPLGLKEELSQWPLEVIETHLSVWERVHLSCLETLDREKQLECLAGFFLEATWILPREFRISVYLHSPVLDAFTRKDLQDGWPKYRERTAREWRNQADDLLVKAERDHRSRCGHTLVQKGSIGEYPCFYCDREVGLLS